MSKKVMKKILLTKEVLTRELQSLLKEKEKLMEEVEAINSKLIPIEERISVAKEALEDLNRRITSTPKVSLPVVEVVSKKEESKEFYRFEFSPGMYRKIERKLLDDVLLAPEGEKIPTHLFSSKIVGLRGCAENVARSLTSKFFSYLCKRGILKKVKHGLYVRTGKRQIQQNSTEDRFNEMSELRQAEMI